MHFVWGFPMLQVAGFDAETMNSMSATLAVVYITALLLVGLHHLRKGYRGHNIRQMVKSVVATLVLMMIAWTLGTIAIVFIVPIAVEVFGYKPGHRF